MKFNTDDLTLTLHLICIGFINYPYWERSFISASFLISTTNGNKCEKYVKPCFGRDYDGKVTPEEVVSAAMYLKDTLGKEGIYELISNLSKDRG